jgi:hypothetical protein
MSKTKRTWVKIEYNDVNNFSRKPEYADYKDRNAALQGISVIKAWGIGIRSAEIVAKKGA